METTSLEELEISTDKSKLDIPYIHQNLNKTYWAAGIPIAVVKQSIDHSFCFGVYRSGKQIGFARVITDFTTFAYLSDVFIDAAYRQHGIAKKLLPFILEHPDLQGLRRWVLVTKDAQTLYTKFGFSELKYPERYMEIVFENVYK